MKLPQRPLIVKQLKLYINDPLYRNSLYLMASTIVMAGLGFIFWAVAARFYTEAAVGRSAAIISAITLLALMSRLGLNVALVRFLPKAEKPADMINSCFTLSGLVSVAVAGIFLVGLGIWSPALELIRENPVFSVVFVLIVLVLTLSGVMDFAFVARRKANFALLKNTIFSLLRIPLPIGLILYFRTFGIVASWGVAVAIALVISLFLFVPRVEAGYRPVPKLNREIIKSIRRYAAGNYLAALLGSAPGLILPIMILNLLGSVQNAYFYVAWMIAGLLFAIPISVSQSLFAEGSHFAVPLNVNVRRSYKFIFLLLVPAIILLLLAGKWLLLLFGAGYSANALMLLSVLSISSVFVAINSIYMTILRVTDRIAELLALYGFITIVALVGSYLITPTTGIIGIGYVWIAVQGVVSVYVAFAMLSLRLRGKAAS